MASRGRCQYSRPRTTSQWNAAAMHFGASTRAAVRWAACCAKRFWVRPCGLNRQWPTERKTTEVPVERSSTDGLALREVGGLPDPNVRPPTVAESGDPFAGLRVAHLIARLPRGVPVRLRDVVDRLNSDYLDWSFSRSVVAAVAVQLQANWLADFRTSAGFELREGDRGDELVIEDSTRVEPWLVRQVERISVECRETLRTFAREETDIA